MRRIRLLLAAAAVVLLALFGTSTSASAQDSGHGSSQEETVHAAEELAKENGATKYDAECVKILTEGGTVDECQAAPNPLLPETNEIIYGFIGFAIVFLVLWKLAWPSIKKGLDGRTERIRGDLESAESQRTEAAEILAQYQAQLADARAESARIIEEARQAADQVKADLQARAEADIAELRQRALSDIESAKAQVSDDLRREVTALAIGAAEQVVGRSLDRDTNVALVEAYIDQVGANS